MELFTFKAFAFGGELDLNRLAVKLGITRKYRWEEPMKLNPVTFSLATGSDEERVYLYYFGGVVFLNCSGDIIVRFLDSIPQYAESLKGQIQLPYREEYRLEIDPEREPAITNDCAVMPHYNLAFLDIICFVIAKSVALERIEERIDVVFDEVEGLIANLGRGKLEIPDRDMARLASSILGFKFTSIAHIMVLDKPEITWDNPEADRLYLTMASLFELNQRYQEIKHKSETLLDMTDVFTGLSHARRAARLEWIIIILIAIEIVIYVMQLYRGH
ncbi:MAG TPA: RMD1 family protein [Desulfuromonadales bacterium]|nr:RMD1 family protein [Desulfuromonadales bacterium]